MEDREKTAQSQEISEDALSKVTGGSAGHDNPLCPHCGYDSFELFPGDNGEDVHKCLRCGHEW